ncbi:MAG: alpha/beta hydrolase, partial [Pirellulales bacterium]|nr:alpha/beta hydrolase [Pirellulales bacterium]
MNFLKSVVMMLIVLAGGELWGQQDDSVVLQQDVVYGRGGNNDLHLDIAFPKDRAQPAPCVVLIHGGAWRQGDKRHLAPQIIDFAKRGYVAATLQYRFCPKHHFPAQVEDVKCAVRYLRAHAEQYGIDPERFGAVGFSAGAHLSMMLGTMDAGDGLEGEGGWPDQSSKVQAVVSFFGPTELHADDIPPRSIPLVADFIGGDKEDLREAYQQASPLTYVSKGDAAMLLFQGTEDVLVPYSQAAKMVTSMTKADVPGRVEFLIDANHGWGGQERNRTEQATYRF